MLNADWLLQSASSEAPSTWTAAATLRLQQQHQCVAIPSFNIWNSICIFINKKLYTSENGNIQRRSGIKYSLRWFQMREGWVLMWAWLLPHPLSVRKRLGFLFTPKCLISIISVRIKYGPRSATVQPLWLHKSLAGSQRYCLSDSSNAPVTWNWERGSMPLGKSDNPLNISSWTNVQASFNPSNRIKHTPQGPWVIFHIKGPARCRWGFIPAEHLMNSANFLLWAPISCGVLPLLRNSFKVHQLFQSALKFMVRLFTYVYYPISGRKRSAQGQLL